MNKFLKYYFLFAPTLSSDLHLQHCWLNRVLFIFKVPLQSLHGCPWWNIYYVVIATATLLPKLEAENNSKIASTT